MTSLAITGTIGPLTNLWGSGSFVFSLFPDASRDLRLDTFYPVGTKFLYPYAGGYLDYNNGGFKRYYDERQRFEFIFPAAYVLDQRIYMQQQDRAYNQRMMDPTLASLPPGGGRPPSRRSQQGIAVALGPAGETGAENLSVVVGSLAPGFTLRGALGSPTEGAERLLKETIAKQAVVRETTLLGAAERTSAKSGRPLYQFEYRVDYESESQPPSYTICVVGSANGELFTFASRVPEAVWSERAAALREAASSFVLF